MALALERAVAAALAVTVFAFACGSSIVNGVLLVGRPGRWICLGILVGLALTYAVASRPRKAPPPFVYICLAFLGLAVASTAWSVEPLLTFKRAGAFGLLAAAGTGLLYGSRARPETVRRLILGLLTGMTAVAVAGVVLLVVARSDAIQPATFEYAARYQGFGQNPNTVALLLALGTPLALFFTLEARSQLARGCAICVTALFVGSITASGSRGAMLGALAGALLLVLTRAGSWRQRLRLAVVASAVFAAALGVSRIPEPKPPPTPATARAVAPTRRTLFTSSGRTAAWRGAIRQAAKRPLLGYGFGTEERVFVNRYRGFVSDVPENSYIGATLQLGIAGVGLFLLVAAVALLEFVNVVGRLGRRTCAPAAACAGVVVAGLTAAVTQSYLFSVGNIATASVWLAMFLLASAAAAD